MSNEHGLHPVVPNGERVEFETVEVPYVWVDVPVPAPGQKERLAQLAEVERAAKAAVDGLRLHTKRGRRTGATDA